MTSPDLLRQRYDVRDTACEVCVARREQVGVCHITLEATKGQILSQSHADATSGRYHLNGRGLKKPSICPWVVSRAGKERGEPKTQTGRTWRGGARGGGSAPAAPPSAHHSLFNLLLQLCIY
jgi:hypothetical protein